MIKLELVLQKLEPYIEAGEISDDIFAMDAIEKECTLAWFYGHSEDQHELQLSLKHYKTGLELIYFEPSKKSKREYLAVLSEVSYAKKSLNIDDIDFLFSEFLNGIHLNSEDELAKAMFSYNILKRSLDVDSNSQKKKLYLGLANFLRFPDPEVV